MKGNSFRSRTHLPIFQSPIIFCPYCNFLIYCNLDGQELNISRCLPTSHREFRHLPFGCLSPPDAPRQRMRKACLSENVDAAGKRKGSRRNRGQICRVRNQKKTSGCRRRHVFIFFGAARTQSTCLFEASIFLLDCPEDSIAVLLSYEANTRNLFPIISRGRVSNLLFLGRMFVLTATWHTPSAGECG
jgi:hypothetical protein